MKPTMTLTTMQLKSCTVLLSADATLAIIDEITACFENNQYCFITFLHFKKGGTVLLAKLEKHGFDESSITFIKACWNKGRTQFVEINGKRSRCQRMKHLLIILIQQFNLGWLARIRKITYLVCCKQTATKF